MMHGFKCFLDDVPPGELVEALLHLRPGEVTTAAALEKQMSSSGASVSLRFRTNTVGRLRDLGLIRGDRHFEISDAGLACKRVYGFDPSEFFEVAHYLHLLSAASGGPAYLWSYLLICEFLSENPAGATQMEVSSYVLQRLEERYPGRQPVFDKASIGKCYRWLKQIAPNPLPHKKPLLEWRNTAYARAFLLAVACFYRLAGFEFGYPVLLDGQHRWGLRRLAFLTEEALDQVLRELVEEGRLIRKYGVTGTSVTLEALPDVSTIW